MEIFGYPLETVYLFGFILGGILTVLYILFGDIIEGIFEALSEGPINPTLILSFITFFNSMAYLMERFSSINSLIIAIASLVTAFLLVTLLNIFVLVPLSQAEATLAYSDDDLKGRIGTVITAIPEEGFGEVMIQGKQGNIARSAISFDDVAIPYGEKVLIIEVKNSVLHVSPHEELD
ncbi:membrane-bound ClpP family serine protease [Evansella vedderi]|uniref:Membrane-bound ClpP family serine protease n=1 Tax=Evansella vedderi TaxID=38282 RepID=A0ABT9ZXG8_9BACI|nr:NfeD family protein [Evansella vedderi]MDQ0255929.1 membrane-bound ClpP family serine protease [Evansella vedderi]